VGAWFVVADDDCLPFGRHFVERALTVAETHPDFGVLAAADVTGPSPPDAGNREVLESHAVGGICFVSPRCPTFDFETARASETDGARYALVQSAGLKEGYMTRVRMNHLGYGFSMATEDWWYIE
jgi:hypothetical protein